jgi:hypothetical protein
MQQIAYYVENKWFFALLLTEAECRVPAQENPKRSPPTMAPDFFPRQLRHKEDAAISSTGITEALRSRMR